MIEAFSLFESFLKALSVVAMFANILFDTRFEYLQCSLLISVQMAYNEASQFR